MTKANPAIKVGPPAKALNFHNMNKANQVVRVAVDQMTLIKVESKIREAMDRVLWQEEDGDEEEEAVENYVVFEDDDDVPFMMKVYPVNESVAVTCPGSCNY